MQPVTVPINVELVEVTEFVQRMVFQIVNDNLVFFCRLRLVLKSIGSHHSGTLEWHKVLGVVAWVLLLCAESSGCCLLIAKSLNTTLH